jgi:hypothetical protein
MNRVALVLLLGSFAGCGKVASNGFPDAVPATGIVRLNGDPLPNSMVAFIPKPGTKGIESYGVTDQDGCFSLQQTRGGAGASPGQYSVVINRFVLRDGTPIEIDPKMPPANQGAVESLPPTYSDSAKTLLTANVPEDGGEFEFDLKSMP